VQQRFFGQKFVIAVFILVVTTVALFLGKVTETGWEIVSLSVLAGFGGLNLASKLFRPDSRLASVLADEDLEANSGKPGTPT
jgi:hypothetical protein